MRTNLTTLRMRVAESDNVRQNNCAQRALVSGQSKSDCRTKMFQENTKFQENTTFY